MEEISLWAEQELSKRIRESKGGMMEYRKLGKLGTEVSIIGLGTEYLDRRPKKTVISVVNEAINRGVNYVDVLFTFREYLDHMGAALRGHRDKVIVAGHLGAAEKNGIYRKTRDVKECETLFLNMLSQLHTDFVDVAFLQFVAGGSDYEKVMGSGGLLELGFRLQQEGKIGLIGLSGHDISVTLKAVRDGRIDIVMFPINLTSNAMLREKDLLNVCVNRRVGLVAMKPFAGGKLLQKSDSRSITAVQCISYALAQTGVSTVVAGVQNVRELEATLHFLNATNEEKDFSSIIADFQEDWKGECVYCNHCLPCPVIINIGETIRLVDTAQPRISGHLQADYDALSVKASVCTECGSCSKRCPFGVDVISKMRRAVELFETRN